MRRALLVLALLFAACGDDAQPASTEPEAVAGAEDLSDGLAALEEQIAAINADLARISADVYAPAQEALSAPDLSADVVALDRRLDCVMEYIRDLRGESSFPRSTDFAASC